VVAKYCDEYACLCVCLSVCRRGYLRNHTRDFYQIFCACCLCLWLGPVDYRPHCLMPIAGKGFSSPSKMHYRPGKGDSVGKVCYVQLPYVSCYLSFISVTDVTGVRIQPREVLPIMIIHMGIPKKFFLVI